MLVSFSVIFAILVIRLSFPPAEAIRHLLASRALGNYLQLVALIITCLVIKAAIRSNMVSISCIL